MHVNDLKINVVDKYTRADMDISAEAARLLLWITPNICTCITTVQELKQHEITRRT